MNSRIYRALDLHHALCTCTEKGEGRVEEGKRVSGGGRGKGRVKEGGWEGMEKGEGEKGRWKRGKGKVELEEGGNWGGK